MSLKAIRCPNCGGDIEVSQEKDFANCDYCGGIISVRDSIKIVTNINTGNLHELARNALQVGNFGESYNFFNKVLEIDINNLEAWIGKLITNITSKDSFNANFNKVLSLSDSKQKTNQLLVEYCTYLIKFETDDIIEIALECITDHPDADLFFLIEYSKFLIKNKRHFEIKKLNTLVDRNIDDEKLKTLKESISLILIDNLDKHDILSKSRIISSSEFIFSICSDPKILNKLIEKITSIIYSYYDATTCTNIDNASLSEILNLIRYSSEKSKVYKNFENLENLCILLYREYSTCTYDKRINNKDYYKNINDIFLSLTRYIKKETGRSEKNYIKGYKSKFLSRFVLVIIGIIAIHYFINFFTSSDNKNETKNNINLEVKESLNKNNGAFLSKNDGTVGVFKGFNNKNLNKIITYAYNNETDKINKIVNQFKSQSKIPRGDRGIARKFNDNGLAQMKENKITEAIFSFTKAAEADPADIEIINNLAVALFENNRFDDGLEVLEKVFLLSIDRTIPWFSLYDALARQHLDINSTCGSLLLALKFSKNQTKTLDFIENDILKNSDEVTKISKREAINCAKDKLKYTAKISNDHDIKNNKFSPKNIENNTFMPYGKMSKVGDGVLHCSKLYCKSTITFLDGINSKSSYFKYTTTDSDFMENCMAELDNKMRCETELIKIKKENKVYDDSIISGDCEKNIIVALDSKFLFNGINTQGDDPKYNIIDISNNEPLNGSQASGYDLILSYFRILCPAKAPADN